MPRSIWEAVSRNARRQAVLGSKPVVAKKYFHMLCCELLVAGGGGEGKVLLSRYCLV